MIRMLERFLIRVLHFQLEQLRLMSTLGFMFGLTLLALFLVLAVFILYTAAASCQPWAIAHLWRALLGLGIILFILRILHHRVPLLHCLLLFHIEISPDNICRFLTLLLQ